jgi:hypothetical protein
MVVSQPFLYIAIKGRVGYMNSIGDRLERWEKAKQGNPWDWIKNKMIDTYLAG